MVLGRINPVIVNFRTPDLTIKCVESILDWGVAAPGDVIVVENCSGDDSLKQLKTGLPDGVRLITAESNGGFSAGVNIGAANSSREFILVLNPDTYFVDGSVSKALDVLDGNPNIGLVGLDLIYPNNERQYSARRFYSVLDIVGRRTPLGRYWPLRNRILKHLMIDCWSSGVPFDADWVMGTGFIVRRGLFEEVGRMSEDYFLYMEDVDLCARVWKSGNRVVCVPGATLIHDHRRSSAAGLFSEAGQMHLKSLLTFMRRHEIPIW